MLWKKHLENTKKIDMEKPTRWEYIGGNQYSLFEESSDGYENTVCSIEVSRYKHTTVTYMSRPLTKSELEDILNIVLRDSL